MKKKLLALLLAFACLMLTGCTALEDAVGNLAEDTQALIARKAVETGLEGYTRTMLDALIADDVDLALTAMAPEITREDLVSAFEQMCTIFSVEGDYTLTPVSWNQDNRNGTTQTDVQFLVETGDQAFVVQATALTGVERMAHFYIAPYQPVTATGSTETLEENSLVQNLLLVAAVLEALFVIWALVDCCRHKFPRKWLYVLMILFVNVLMTFTLSGTRLGMKFNLGLYLTYTGLMQYSTGETVLRLFVPLGAVIYLLRRGKLLTTAKDGFREAFSAADDAAVEAPAASQEAPAADTSAPDSSDAPAD